jgi:glycosyltransferase involved in cell wall biosynthesis
MAISREALVVMSFGWHWQIKGGELFQRAVADLAARTSREVVAIHTTSAPEAFRMRSELGLENTIRLVEQTGDVAGLMAAADVFVAASRAEGGTPLAVLEALSTGLPVVASDLPSHRYVAEHASGIAVVERDPRRVSTAILEATSGTEVERLNRGKASHDAVERHFSFERWCTALFETYDEVSARAFKDATMARPA